MLTPWVHGTLSLSLCVHTRTWTCLWHGRFNYFEEEDLDLNAWAASWLSGLLARELPLKCLLRLWDTYLADAQLFSLHVFVCLGPCTAPSAPALCR
jgi:hypothetical protein